MKRFIVCAVVLSNIIATEALYILSYEYCWLIIPAILNSFVIIELLSSFEKICSHDM